MCLSSFLVLFYKAKTEEDLNRFEAQNVEKIITKLLKMGIEAEQIGVVTQKHKARSLHVYIRFRKVM